MIAAPRKRIILQDGEQVKLHQPARDDEGFSPAAKIDDRPKGRFEGFVDCRKTERADHVKSQTEFPIHGVMEGGGSYNLHAGIPGGRGQRSAALLGGRGSILNSSARNRSAHYR
jgi:hypothetical protein